MKITITTLLICCICFGVIYGQGKSTPPENSPRPVVQKPAFQINQDGIQINPPTTVTLPSSNYQQFAPATLRATENLKIYRDPVSKIPTWIRGTPKNISSQINSIREQAFAYLEAIKVTIGIENPAEEFTITNIDDTDPQAIHIRLQQLFNNRKVYGSEIMLHTKTGQIQLFNGRFYPTPALDIRAINIDQPQAENIVQQDIVQHTVFQILTAEELKFVDGAQFQSEQIIYHLNNDPAQPRLAWHVRIIPNITNRWEYFVDTQTGAILDNHKSTCQLFGWHEDHDNHACSAVAKLPESKPTTAPTTEQFFTEETAVAPDLNNINREIDVWREGNTWLMIDADRTMYNNGQSNLPNDGVGIIATFDANNTYPGPGAQIDLVNHGNNNSWTRNEVSAHYNSGVAYEYFRSTFGRNSIKNQGENIFSVINVSDEDGNDMDNAFWNGETMFYGNGDQAFSSPLAKALDVAGHEMAHGVVQSTANLVYQNESGALNESFADIFGAMIDREDWQIGEEVASNVFPTGTMRDMANPNNGGNSNNFYWQPAHYNERYTGSQDDGGVHINSGIPNHAYYLFATSNGVGKDKAEQIFFKALDDYLVMSSQFVDLRIAVLQAAIDLHGGNSTEVAAAAAAFDAVGIVGEDGGDYQIDTGANPGTNYILWSDDNLSNINTSSAPPGATTLGAFTDNDHRSRASISDDGSVIVYVHNDRSLRLLDIDWSMAGGPQVTGNFNLESTLSWRNMVISKDGTKFAAIYGDLEQNVYDNEVFVYDFVSQDGNWFILSNPTTANGLSTGDVLYADALEWDLSGEYLMYDAYNEISSNFGEDISYWDIGIMKVWNNNTNSFAESAEPTISKVFANLGENVSVGNPTFAKNSPYIIAFDYIEPGFFGTDYSVYGYNIQTGDQGIIFENNKAGYPNFSVDDQFVMFSVENNDLDILAYRGVGNGKISGTGDAFILVENAAWGSWYANGERNLTTVTNTIDPNTKVKVVPNPTTGQLNVEINHLEANSANLKVYDALGQLVISENITISADRQIYPLDLSSYQSGAYLIRLITATGQITQKVIKL